jgi:ATP/maltotriose-dependent transcriptional regulator MalT
VAAPAGYSKTTAVRAWCATLDVGLAWIGLNDADSDRRRRVSQVAGRVGKARESAPGDGESKPSSRRNGEESCVPAVAQSATSLKLVLEYRVGESRSDRPRSRG